ncbi:cyclic nucleotide-binding domain-containing protein [Marinifilum sp. N1E240]|uniref:Crp/Fnr family transcriptional regulator n=1 Tax=Marinifilum sp. N1E240 TaxID=2608082 RepID=UPI00128BD54D|nr:Crp/Fnr family transcriptional regulator [uncultured Marinifilum sp.]MPQ48951.1 cyclic nucleotide-binding domain-containing protein [Marinifilum sp. N1E240]
MDKIRQHFEQLVPLSEEEWEDISKGFYRQECAKGELILSQGDECDFIAFIEIGLFRFYHVKDGSEKIITFWFSGDVFSEYRSYITHTPSTNYIESMQDGIIWKIKREHMLDLYDKYPNLERLGRKFAERTYLKLADRLDSFLQDSPKERYLDLLNRNPNFVQEIPQYMIASFLGISAESLSRLRKRI